jgi:signal transduction histidine kinase
LEELVEDMEILASGLKLEHQLQPGVQVLADADLIQQVLQNLASNGVKYNQPGGVIRLELSANETEATLRIGNTGPGIAVADRGKIFERFFRSDPARSRSVTGVGLGLSLSREIARAHGGELALDNSTTGLTTFTLTLPLARVSREVSFTVSAS